jgi:magnesium chelatase accessory protein
VTPDSLPLAQSELHWEIDGRDWPNRSASRFVDAGGLTWHVQLAGHGPALLLLHGTGASSHSWRDLFPLLSRHFTVLAPDLPGHGFTGMPPSRGLSLPGMAKLLGDLLNALSFQPLLVVGHSAGAALGAQMCLDARLSPQWLVSINGAWQPFPGLAGKIFSPLARVLSHSHLPARLLAASASDRRVVERLLEKTGSRIDRDMVDSYMKLVRSTRHNAAALGMMANWDLNPLMERLTALRCRLYLLVGDRDRMVSPEQAEWLHHRMPTACVHRIAGCGHLLHEERPAEIAALIEKLWQSSADQGAI